MPGDLDGLDGLVIPGGESTTMTLGVEREGLAEPLRTLRRRGHARCSGSCAGLIMLDRDHLGLMDIGAERNAFGRQISSFEADVEVERHRGAADARHLHPRAMDRRARPGVEVLGSGRRPPRGGAQRAPLGVAFHAELGEDERLHRLFLELVERGEPGRARWAATRS